MTDFYNILLGIARTIDFPALVLLIFFVAGYYILQRAQKQDGFNLANMLKDDASKESMAALCGLWCFAIMSWQVMYDTVKQGTVDNQLFIYYGILWSGVKVVEKLLDKWNGQMPFAKPAASQ